MKTYTYTLSPNTGIDSIPFTQFAAHPHTLVQIFCGEDAKALQYYATSIQKELPNVICIGTTTDGEIAGEQISICHTVITISLFEQTTLKSASANTADAYHNGMKIAKALVTEETRLLILFSDGTTTNGEMLLKGINDVNSDVVIAGGMAGDNGRFVQTYILEGATLFTEGVVGVSLNSKVLSVQNNFNFNWSPIGIEHTIEKVKNNRVYRIDGLSAVAFYTKYLGEHVAKALPATGIEFPLILERDGIQYARAVIAKHEDDSLSFAGNLMEGDRVRLGFGNAGLIINESLKTFSQRYSKGVETFFIYSCMARRRYMPDFIQTEIKPFAKLAPTSGFFTYGEFYHHQASNLLLNQTLTVVALSESASPDHTPSDGLLNEHLEESDYATTIKALTHLIQQSTNDYERQAQKLEEEKRFSQQLLQMQRRFLQHAIHEINTPLSVIMNNIELYELEHGSQHYLSNIEAAMKNIYGIYDDLGYLINKNHIDYPKKEIALVDFVRSRIEFFDVVARQANIRFNFQTNCEESYLYINESKLQRIIDNNITNAIKYTKEHQEVTISLDYAPQYCLLSIESQSMLIRDEEKIFQAYYRESSTKEGLGLGLDLVKQICDEEGIEIEVSSTQTRTRFSYKIPRS